MPDMPSNPLLINIALRPIQPDCLDGLDSLDSLKVTGLDQHELATHPQRRLEQLTSRAWRRQILAAALGQAPEKLSFAKDNYGKPYVSHNPQLQLSQSHCAQQFVLAFNRQGIALGVDIESSQRKINLAGLAKRILTAIEMQAFRQAQNPQGYVLKRWTIKEAVLKACGLGIRLNLNTVETENPLLANQQQPVAVAYHAAIGEWAYQCFETADYYYTVAWQQRSGQQVSFHWLV